MGWCSCGCTASAWRSSPGGAGHRLPPGGRALHHPAPAAPGGGEPPRPPRRPVRPAGWRVPPARGYADSDMDRDPQREPVSRHALPVRYAHVVRLADLDAVRDGSVYDRTDLVRVTVLD